jgi:hypothetical protein
LILILSGSAAFGQLTTGAISGTVADTSGALISGARVTAKNSATDFTRTVSSDASGFYRLDLLPIGVYKVTVESNGFKTAVEERITLNLNAELRYDAKLQPGEISESITVSASEVPLVETTNAVIGRTVDNVEVDNLPIVGRNVYDLLALAPGVQASVAGNNLGYPEQRVVINGGYDNGSGSVSYYLDGGINMTTVRNTGNVVPNPDALQEFNVQTNSYNALYGRMSSGLVNVATKSGTNQLHGSMFEFLRNTNLNATSAFSTSKSPYHRNQFGATLGGPIFHDKTFFFGSYGGLRLSQSAFYNSAIVPSLAETNSGFTDFSDRTPTSSGAITSSTSCKITLSTADKAAGNFLICNPVTRKPLITGGVINKGLVPDPVALNVMAYLVKTGALVAGGNTTNGVAPVMQETVPYTQQTDEFLVKIDHNLNQSHRLGASYFNTPGNMIQLPGGNLNWSALLYKYRQQNANLSDAWMIGANRINTLVFSYTRQIGGRVQVPDTSLSAFGSTFVGQGTMGLPKINVSGYFNLNQTIAGPLAGTNFYAVRDVFNWTKGKHAIAFGGEGSLDKSFLVSNQNNYGIFTFAASSTARSGAALSDFFYGLPSAQNQDAPTSSEINDWFYGVYLQDDYKVLPRLMLNMGVRWDVQSAPLSNIGNDTYKAGVQSVVLPTAPLGQLFPGDPGVSSTIIGTRYHHVSPRLGMAWDVFGDGKTAVRGAVGLFYGMLGDNNSIPKDAPFQERYAYPSYLLGSLSNPYSALPHGNPFPYTYNPKAAYPTNFQPNGISPLDMNMQSPYTYQVNLTVEQQLPHNIAVMIAYVGSSSHDLPGSYDINAPIYETLNGAAPTTTNADLRRPVLPGVLTTINLQQSHDRAHYNGMQASIEKRMTGSLSVKAYYAWSQSLSSNEVQGTTITAPSVQDAYAPWEEFGLSTDNLKHQSVSTIVWKPNYFTNSNRYVRGAANGWTLSGIVTLQSGSPVTITTGVDNNLDGQTTDRASILPGQSYAPATPFNRWTTGSTYFNTGYFCTAASAVNGTACPGIGPNGLDGNTRRNNYTGPGSRNVNASLFRNFSVFEQVKMQLRAEVTNLFNLVNLNNPTSAMNSTSFGTIRAAGTMRQIQVGARILF